MENGKDWGTDVVPEEKWIKTDKVYRTKSGKRVIDLEIVLKNSCGNEVTFPVKGSIVVREKPLKTKYTIWTLDGRHTIWGASDFDLIEVGE